MKNLFFISRGFCLLTVLLLVFGCKKDGHFKVSPTTLTPFSFQSGTKSLLIESSSDWSATLTGMTGSWCSLTINHINSERGTVSVHAEENMTIETRSCTLVISCEGFPPVQIPVTQESGVSSLSLSESVILESSGGGSHTLEIYSNTEWTLSLEGNEGNWITAQPVSGEGNASFVLTISPNLTGYVRHGSLIAIAADTLIKTIPITQATSRVFEIEVPDFSDSKVYQVFDDRQSVMATLCREYIPEAGVLTVIYKVNAQNSLLDRGYVLENGGSVNPDGSGYIAGNSSPAQRVYLQDEMFIPSYSGSITRASLSPYYMLDYQGNEYSLLKAGSLFWMSENLRVTVLNDGIALQNGQQNWPGIEEAIPSYCDYHASPQPGRYGLLYNWFAVNTGKLAPQGWHVASDSEWNELEDLLGGVSVAGGKLKAEGTVDWVDPNQGASDLIGFYALPGGYRSPGGTMQNLGYTGNWWTATEGPASSVVGGISISTTAYYRSIAHSAGAIFRTYSKRESGYSVRCVRNVR